MLVKLILLAFFISIVQVLTYNWIDIPFSNYMLSERFDAYWNNDKSFVFKYQWVPSEEISKHTKIAVIASEDQLFVNHFGLDLKAIGKAFEANQKSKTVKGASTITQQTVKNVFLWHGKSYFRKAVEVYYTFLVELIWGKERILEVYLNVIETSKGIFGVEATANSFFKKSAKQLNRYESAQIAAVLPNPKRLKITKPSSYLIRRQTWILKQMARLSGEVDLSFSAE